MCSRHAVQETTKGMGLAMAIKGNEDITLPPF
ncbi:hypothetical protein BWQ96_04999 [Gracilariopsis chorda]|uniref:Uncharacterized protein n=1 Tax=Gracilariopsis chorda TaxID=448386 RepID=A0A2V3ISY5_9FLOR|nr:hypothetical protein BWQ96_04999 [Gracilariopsis chorda]|eukprot:PXF45233.1 hypothetical protein BWQ96_04999 [Gracilariopsis chorda]